MKELLPLGSVVELNNTKKDPKEKFPEYFVIIGKRRNEKDEYDYTAVKYPYGFVDRFYYFNDTKVKNLVRLGDINYKRK